MSGKDTTCGISVARDDNKLVTLGLIVFLSLGGWALWRFDETVRGVRWHAHRYDHRSA